MFISFEGIDKSGKSTQISLLVDYLKQKGYEAVQTCEPGGTRLGKKIERILLEPSTKEISGISELFLYLADRAEHVEKIIKPALEKGKIVISDRFADATIAYQGHGRELDIPWIKELNKRVTHGLSPDITFLLDISPDLAQKRSGSEGKDRIENEKISFHQKVRQGYLKLAKRHTERIKAINGEGSVEEIQLTIRKILAKHLWRKKNYVL